MALLKFAGCPKYQSQFLLRSNSEVRLTWPSFSSYSMSAIRSKRSCRLICSLTKGRYFSRTSSQSISLSSKKERSEEHTSELQSCENLVCRLLVEYIKY